MSLGKIENAQMVREALKLACFRVGTQQAWAELHHISPIVVSDMIRGKRDISTRIAATVGFERITVYRKIKK